MLIGAALLLVALFGQNVAGWATSGGRVVPALLEAKGPVNVIVMLDFTPERFHNERLTRPAILNSRSEAIYSRYLHDGNRQYRDTDCGPSALALYKHEAPSAAPVCRRAEQWPGETMDRPDCERMRGPMPILAQPEGRDA